jgi:redox-sensitive bicupin YhaK (pirin superfamily)
MVDLCIYVSVCYLLILVCMLMYVGFETVTIAYQGEVEHGDSVGHRGVIGPGDCQWMTAASGIIHEEFHSREFAKRGMCLVHVTYT